MAQRVQVILEDDLDGSEADETVLFALDGAEYEVDLSTDHAQELRDALAPWVGVSRRTSGRRRRAGAAAAAPVRPNQASGAGTGDIRAWARENGYDILSRGRVPAEIRDAYDKAHR